MQDTSTEAYQDAAAYPQYGTDTNQTYPPMGYSDYAQQPYAGDQYATYPGGEMAAGAAAGAAGVGAGAVAAAGGAGGDVDGLHDNMMVRVKVGFVRSLEDELGEPQP